MKISQMSKKKRKKKKKELLEKKWNNTKKYKNEKYYNNVQTCNITTIDYIKRLDFLFVCFLLLVSNGCIAYKNLLTILVTIVDAKRSFSKLKIIKYYLSWKNLKYKN